MRKAADRGGRVFEGTVVRARNDKTRVVQIDPRMANSLYGRQIKRIAKFVAHDEMNQSEVGDVVRIRETRPLSRTKRWRLIEILKKTQAGK